MQNTAHTLDLREPDANSIWPWLVCAIALALLAFSVRFDLKNIPNSLSQQAHALANQLGASDIDLNVDGRDLTLSGTLNPNVARDPLVNRLDAIPGIRVVVDDMKEFDPDEQYQLEQIGFKQALGSIDFSSIAFEPGSASLTYSSHGVLRQLASILRTSPEFRIRIAGHTDNTGRAEINLRISRQRASSVADFLIDNNVNKDQIIAQGYGATRPIADNATEMGRAANRRIEINYVN